MNARPIHDRIIVRRTDAPKSTPGGIIIPDMASEKPQQGVVVAIGSGTRLLDGQIIPLEVGVGDRILFGKYSGAEIDIAGEKLLIMKEADVLAVLDAAN